MYDYYLFPLPRASKWNRPIFDHSEVKIDLYKIGETLSKVGFNITVNMSYMSNFPT